MVERPELGRRFTEGLGKPHTHLCSLGLSVEGRWGRGQARSELNPLLTFGTPLWSQSIAGTGLQVLVEYRSLAGKLGPTSGLLAFVSPSY